MKSKQLCLAADERDELERFAKTGVRNTRLANRAKIILALDTSGGRFRWQSMAADGSRNWKLTGLSALSIQYLGSKRIPGVGALNAELTDWHVRRRKGWIGSSRPTTRGETQKAVPNYIVNF